MGTAHCKMSLPEIAQRTDSAPRESSACSRRTEGARACHGRFLVEWEEWESDVIKQKC